MDQLNALSTAVIALATVVATWSTWKLAGIERNRELASNGVYVWVTPDHFYMSNGVEGLGNRWLKLNARSTANLPAYDVNIEIILDEVTSQFSSIQKGTVIYKKNFPVLFEHGNEMTPINIDSKEILNSDLRDFLGSPEETYQFKETYEFLATHMRTQISFRDTSGTVWKRNVKGKLKRI